MPRHKYQVISTHVKLNSVDPPKKTSQFRPANENKVNFDPHSKTKLITSMH